MIKTKRRNRIQNKMITAESAEYISEDETANSYFGCVIMSLDIQADLKPLVNILNGITKIFKQGRIDTKFFTSYFWIPPPRLSSPSRLCIPPIYNVSSSFHTDLVLILGH